MAYFILLYVFYEDEEVFVSDGKEFPGYLRISARVIGPWHS
jgi:hypothetical protein